MDFWQHPALAAAFQRRHMGHVIRAYRRHPQHERPLSQEVVAEWAGITQAQLSRIETGPPIVHLDRLMHWARLLKIPAACLWFTLPGDGAEDDVRRSEFLKLGAVAASAAVIGVPSAGPDDAVEDFAWELWQQRRPSMHPSELGQDVAASLARSSFVVMDADGAYALAHPSLLDFFVARRIFGAVRSGESELFASAQTSHDTDQILRRFVAQDPAHVQILTRWMESASDPVLRVNSAGVLGKLSEPGPVIRQLRRDPEMRQLYMTAVAGRVLGLAWDDAARLTARGEFSDESSSRLVTETLNPRDGAARWCSLVMLAGHSADDSLREALRVETVPENLRAIGAVLSGVSPLEV